MTLLWTPLYLYLVPLWTEGELQSFAKVAFTPVDRITIKKFKKIIHSYRLSVNRTFSKSATIMLTSVKLTVSYDEELKFLYSTTCLFMFEIALYVKNINPL